MILVRGQLNKIFSLKKKVIHNDQMFEKYKEQAKTQTFLHWWHTGRDKIMERLMILDILLNTLKNKRWIAFNPMDQQKKNVSSYFS